MDQELARVGASLSRRLFSGFPPEIGRYRIAGRIGAGGMGQVYRGYDPTLGRPVAIKVLGEARGASADDHDALLGEARAMASVSHPNVIEVYEVGVDAGRVFIAMELVDGATLSDWLSDETPGWVETVRAYVQAGEGLHAAHAAGIVHRDFKPSNALMGRDGRVRVLDFGLATVAAGGQRGGLAGTPTYMAPECLRGRAATPRSDQFSFCVSLWQALFGGRPFAADTVEGMRRAAERQRLVRPDRTSVPRPIIDALVRGLHPDPQQRWPSLAPLLDVLRKPVKPRGPFRALALVTGWVGWKVAAGVVLVGLFPALGDAEPCEALRTRRDDDWSSQRRASIASSFEERGRAHAWPVFDEVVDAQMVGLADAYAVACERQRIDEATVALDTELACLRRRYMSLERLLDAVPQADAAQLTRIEDAVHHASSQAACSDGPSGVLPPRIVAALTEADTELAEVEVLRTADRYDEASARLRTLSARAQELRYEPLQARVASMRADVEIVRGNTALAEDSLVLAYQLALALPDHRLALSAATRLTELVGVELSRPAEALEWARHAEVAAERAGKSDPPAALLRVLANVHFMAGQHAQAAALFEQVASAMEGDDSLPPRERIEELRKMATVHLHLERKDDARDAFAKALALAEAEYGPQTHNVAALAFNLGVTTVDPVEQVALFERAATIYGDLFDDHPDLGDALYKWGQALAVVGRSADAEEKMRGGIAMLARGIGDTHPYVLDCRTSLVGLLLDEQRYDEAFELAVSVHADAQAKMGEGHPVTAGARELVGAALDALGDAEAARRAYEDAARLSRESPEPDIRMVLRTTASLAEFRARNGEPEVGRAQLEQAAAQAGDVVGTSHPLWADLQLRALALKPETETAPEDLARAKAALGVLGQGAQARGYASALFSVARLEHAHGDPDEARARAEALAARLRQTPRDATLAAEVDRWLASAVR
ncbi:MAG: protein kinase domain-containing protein [Nannocystaceae bacterium]|nr:protein kinase [bacterium]